MPDLLDSLTFGGNSRAMLQAVFEGAPLFFRGMLREYLNGWVRDNQIKAVDEATVFRAVNDLAPPAMAREKIIPMLEKLRSK